MFFEIKIWFLSMEITYHAQKIKFVKEKNKLFLFLDGAKKVLALSTPDIVIKDKKKTYYLDYEEQYQDNSFEIDCCEELEKTKRKRNE